MDKTKYICSINQLFDKMKIRNYRRQDRQDRYLQNLGGVFFSHDSQLFGTDSFFFFRNTVGTQIADTFGKWVPFTHRALYIRKLSPHNEPHRLIFIQNWFGISRYLISQLPYVYFASSTIKQAKEFRMTANITFTALKKS